MRKLKLISILATVSFAVLPACQQLEPDAFDKPSSARMSDFLEDIRTTLAAEQYGWTMDYFPGSKYAGVTYALKFTNQEVTARLETNPTVSETSSYALKTDDGAVLSFDTYNTVLHAYATPDQKNYQAKGGDFEFEISSFDKEKKEIVLIGKRSRNHILTENTLRFSQPFSIGNVKFDEWTYDAQNGTLNGSGVSFVKFIPPGYVTFEEYLGDYTFYYSNGNRNFKVSLVEDEPGRTFKMKGFSTYFEPVLTFDGGRGRLNWIKQTIGGSGSLEYILAPWDSNAGYLTWKDGVGLVGSVEDNSVPDFVITFADNGVWEDYTANAWLLWSMNGDSSAGAVSSWTTGTGSYQVPGALSMKKIVE